MARGSTGLRQFGGCGRCVVRLTVPDSVVEYPVTWCYFRSLYRYVQVLFLAFEARRGEPYVETGAAPVRVVGAAAVEQPAVIDNKFARLEHYRSGAFQICLAQSAGFDEAGFDLLVVVTDQSGVAAGYDITGSVAKFC